MKIKDLLKDEWIGRQIIIVDSKNKYNIGIKGTVINETKNMFVIKTNNGEKKIMKADNIFQTEYQDKTVNVKGNALLASPEERLKAKV